MIGDFNGYGIIAAILVVIITIIIGAIYSLCKNCKGTNSRKINL